MARDRVGVGVVGYGWIARAHVHALHVLDHLGFTARIEPVVVAGRTPERAAVFAQDLGFARWTTNASEAATANDVDVVLVATPVEAHAEAVRAALGAGKAVLSEKPLAADGAEARELADAAEAAAVTNATGFNYRYVPAIALAKELVAGGRLGRLVHYRALYLQDYQALGTQTRPSHGGAGAVLDYCHLVDMLRFLAGEPRRLVAQTASVVSANEDQFAAVLELAGGVTATLEASRCALGWKGRHRVEVNGADGSLWWDMEDPNRLHVFFRSDEEAGLGGFRDVLVTNPEHPFVAQWWPPGHVLGWEHAMVHQWRDFLEAALARRPVPERQASFRDGWRAAVICDAIVRAARDDVAVSGFLDT